jgi:hypothetical protein
MLILTPISKEHRSSGPDSRRDYEEQLERHGEGGTWMWDDVSPNVGGNKAVVGDDFAFVFNGDKVRWHKVTEVCSPEMRHPTSAKNEGQSHRQVVYVSDMVREMSWSEWLDMGGYAKVQGTMYARRMCA